jgi:hypothetical protein
MRRKVFEEVHGFDERFRIEFNDIDLCLRLGEHGYWIVWTPHAELTHWESKTRGHYADTPEKRKQYQHEVRRFLERWGDVVAGGDPFYHPLLTTDTEDYRFGPGDGWYQPQARSSTMDARPGSGTKVTSDRARLAV